MPPLWISNDPKGTSVGENMLRFHLIFCAGGRRGKCQLPCDLIEKAPRTAEGGRDVSSSVIAKTTHSQVRKPVRLAGIFGGSFCRMWQPFLKP